MNVKMSAKQVRWRNKISKTGGKEPQMGAVKVAVAGSTLFKQLLSSVRLT